MSDEVFEFSSPLRMLFGRDLLRLRQIRHLTQPGFARLHSIPINRYRKLEYDLLGVRLDELLTLAQNFQLDQCSARNEDPQEHMTLLARLLRTCIASHDARPTPEKPAPASHAGVRPGQDQFPGMISSRLGMATAGQDDEVWRDIEGDGSYFVSSRGRIYSSHTAKVLKNSARPDGLNRTTLRVAGRTLVRNTHSIVAEAFIGPRPARHMVVHLDGDRANDCADNLAYLPLSERCPTVGGLPEFNVKLSPGRAEEMRAIAAAGTHTGRELAREFGVSAPHASLIASGKRWSAQ